MRLNAKILKNVVGVNNWSYANQSYVSEGQVNDIYLQLVDLDWSVKEIAEKNNAFPEQPIRYIPQGSVVEVKATFMDIDDDEEFVVTASQPFAQDGSIFKLSLGSDQVPNSGNLLITVVEDGVGKSFMIKQAVVVELLNQGGC